MLKFNQEASVDEPQNNIKEITSAQEVGSIFKKARLEMGESLEDVSKKTNIRKCYIKDIEEGQLQYIPGDIYIAGFIQIYSRHLKIDSDEMLRILSIEKKGKTDINASISIMEAHSSRIKPSKWIIIFSTLIAIGLLVYIYK